MSKRRLYLDIRGYHKGVTGSTIRNTIHFTDGSKYRFLVDYGMYQGEGRDRLEYNDSVTPQKINSIFLTHTHLDHDGALPIIVKNGYNGKIYMSEGSAYLMDIGLTDSYNIMIRDARLKKKQRVLYSLSDIGETKRKTVAVKYEEPIRITKNITVTFFQNAHLIGASIILVQIRDYQDEINLLYTGDYQSKNTFLKKKDLPIWVYSLPNLTIITESTYGTTDSNEIEKHWEDDIIRACSENRIIVNTAFGQGRFQELMYRIRCLQESGKIPFDYPVRIDGKTGLDYTFRYMSGAEMLGIKEDIPDWMFPSNTQIIRTSQDRSFVTSKNQRQIIIATSGMGTHGPASTYIPHYLRKSDAVIYITGYTAPGTLGRAILEAKPGDQISFNRGNTFTVKKHAQVIQTQEFSSHAKADELISFLNNFSPRSILVNHGEPEVKKAFAKRIYSETSTNRTGILGLEYVYRITSYGIEKAIEK